MRVKMEQISIEQESIERLFNEPFEPLWMQKQREAKKWAEREAIEAMLERVERRWREKAAESRKRISAKFRQA
jgi:hypothetical protein